MPVQFFAAGQVTSAAGIDGQVVEAELASPAQQSDKASLLAAELEAAEQSVGCELLEESWASAGPAARAASKVVTMMMGLIWSSAAAREAAWSKICRGLIGSRLTRSTGDCAARMVERSEWLVPATGFEPVTP